MKNTHTDKPNYTRTGTHTLDYTLTYTITPLKTQLHTQRPREKNGNTHSLSYLQLYSIHTYIKRNINGHSRVFLIQCTIAHSLLLWPFLWLSISPLSSPSPPCALFFSMYWWLLLPWECCKSVSVAGVGLGSHSPLDHPFYMCLWDGLQTNTGWFVFF